MNAGKVVLLAALIMVVAPVSVYVAGRLFTAGVLREWFSTIKRMKKEDSRGQER